MGQFKLRAPYQPKGSQSTSNPTSISQVAATAALNGDHECVHEMVKAFKKRHDNVHRSLNEIPGIRCLPADGTFYLFPNIQSLIDKIAGIEDDVAFAAHLLTEVGVALVPGTAFGSPGHLRFSFAASQTQLNAALERLQKFVGDL